MLTVLQNITCYAPYFIGNRDILIAGEKILKLLPAGECAPEPHAEAVHPCGGFLAFPGLIDQHVHMTGGGGEQGFASRIEEINADEIVRAGVTTAAGLLGADGSTRSLLHLYAKAKALEAEGPTAYLYSGSYAVPPVTFTGSVTKDLILIDKVIGVGEIAIADHRSSQPDGKELLKLAADTHLGGMLGGKAGVLHLHVGDGKSGLQLLRNMLVESDLPIDMFVPTHMNRNPVLFKEAVSYCKSGGYIDLTAGETIGISVPEAVRRLSEEGVNMRNVTVSSDAQASEPGGVKKMSALYEDLVRCITETQLGPELVFRLFTENVARILKLYPKKGTLQEGSDADILVTDQEFHIKMLFCKGKLLLFQE